MRQKLPQLLCHAAPQGQAVAVEHDVDTSTPGIYHVSYTYGGGTVWMTVAVR